MNKQRITVMLATNGDGTDKLPPYFIGTAKKPKCFKGESASHYGLSYDANAKGWMRSDLFRAWLRDLDAVFRDQERHVLLLMDNAPCHKTEGLCLTNINIHKIAPNTTPFNQPLDAGIIRSFKAHFRRRRDRHAAKYVDSSNKDPYKVDVLTGMQWAVEAWNEIGESTVQNCWRHTKVFPAPGLYEIAEEDLEYVSEPIPEDEEQVLNSSLERVSFCSPMSIPF